MSKRMPRGCFVAGLISAFFPVSTMAEGTAYFPPPDSKGGWRALRGAEQIRRVAGMDEKKLDEAFEFIKGSTKHGGLAVLRKGWLVYENYFGLGHRDATPNLASVGKSHTSIALGILLHERPDLFPDGLDQKVFTPKYLPPEAFPLTDPRKKNIKLGQLLAMTGGIRGNNPSYVLAKERAIDPPGPDEAPLSTDAVASLPRADAGRWRRYAEAASGRLPAYAERRLDTTRRGGRFRAQAPTRAQGTQTITT